MKRLLVIALIGACGLAGSGVALSLLAAMPPEKVVRQGFSCPPTGDAGTGNFQILRTIRWEDGAVVLYRSLCPSKGHSAMQRVFGYQVIGRNGIQWELKGNGSYGSDTPPPEPEKLVEYGIGKSQSTGKDRYMIVYGQALTGRVTAIEATFDTGEVVYSRARDNVFALMAPGATQICELRVIGRYNQILRRDDLTVTKQPTAQKRKWSQRCWQNLMRL